MIEKLTDKQIEDWGHVCGLAGAAGALLGLLQEIVENDIEEFKRKAKPFFEAKRVKFLAGVLRILRDADAKVKKLEGGRV